ncbi:MAG: ATP-binding protein [Acidobacteriia bacterium]|nr:ATP-binding protein [Terriglobia bacterium]
MNQENIEIFEEVREFPDPTAARRYAALVGLDHMKERLLKEARLLFDPESLTAWSSKHHRRKTRLVDFFRDRPPLFIFAGDVGTGKTALAETFGDAVAREANMRLVLFALSLNARGTGAVGEMTMLLSKAFGEVKQAAKKASGRGARHSSGVVLLIDEADALAQSRELAQMHHEDRAGVNALIRGVDDLAVGNLPAMVIMCTNRVDALDPAIRRRAAVTFTFMRPNEQQRQAFLQPVLEELGFTPQQIHSLVTATGAKDGRKYGYSYSDLAQRLLPGLLLAAYPSKPITFELAKEVVENHPPTPPFQAET